MSEHRSFDAKAVLMGLTFAFIWSSAFTSARMIVADAPPLLASAARFAIAGGLGVLIALALGQSFRLTRAQWRVVLVFGLCQNALYLGLNFTAMQWIEASAAAIIASGMPLVVALLGWLVHGEKIRPLGVIGLIAGMAGGVLIMGARLQGGSDPLGIVLCLIAVLALAIATLTVRATGGGNVMMVVGLQMFVGAAILGVVSAVFEPHAVHWTPRLIAAFTYTTLVPGLFATWLWFRLVARIGALKASTFHFLNPFFGVAVAAVFLGEAVRPMDMLGEAIIAAGILAVQMARMRA